MCSEGISPVWLTDPRDAQYLNTTVAELKKTAEDLAADGLIHLDAGMEYATPSDALMGHKAKYDVEVQQALTFIKPTFNEDIARRPYEYVIALRCRRACVAERNAGPSCFHSRHQKQQRAVVDVEAVVVDCGVGCCSCVLDSEQRSDNRWPLRAM